MENRETSLCHYFVDFMTGEMSDVERKRFEHHLQQCAGCREDALEWRLVWDRLAYEAQPVDPPSDLKDKVFGAIFDQRETAATAANTDKPKPRLLLPAPLHRSARRPLRIMAAAIVLLLVFFAGFGVRGIMPGIEGGGGGAQTAAASIDSLYRLAPVAETQAFGPDSHAYGVACLIRSEGRMQFVVYVFGSPKTEGNQAYHVWLLSNGERRSAGTFKVGSSGIGLLAVPWKENAPSFDTVGVTLEPDATSTAPKGPKMFGTVKGG